MKIGILTSGGDCPGLNAVIRGVVLKGTTDVRPRVRRLPRRLARRRRGRHLPARPATRSRASSKAGGTILGTTRTNPFEGSRGGAENIAKTLVRARHRRDHRDRRRGHPRRGRTASTDDGINIVGVPKTIDNDLRATDYTFGFDTAVKIATEAMDRLRTTGDSHQRCMVAEVMGRHVGWIALHSGIAAGAHAILIPEVPMTIDEICALVHEGATTAAARRWSSSSEGFTLNGHGRGATATRDSTPSAARASAASARCSRPRSSASPASRPARPCSATSSAAARRPAFDRVLATRLGLHAADAVVEGGGARWSRSRAPTSSACPSRRRSASSRPCRSTATTRPQPLRLTGCRSRGIRSDHRRDRGSRLKRGPSSLGPANAPASSAVAGSSTRRTCGCPSPDVRRGVRRPAVRVHRSTMNVAEPPQLLLARNHPPTLPRLDRDGALHRIRAGAYVPRTDWERLAPWERYRLRVSPSQRRGGRRCSVSNPQQYWPELRCSANLVTCTCSIPTGGPGAKAMSSCTGRPTPAASSRWTGVG